MLFTPHTESNTKPGRQRINKHLYTFALIMILYYMLMYKPSLIPSLLQNHQTETIATNYQSTASCISFPIVSLYKLWSQIPCPCPMVIHHDSKLYRSEVRVLSTQLATVCQVNYWKQGKTPILYIHYKISQIRTDFCKL